METSNSAAAAVEKTDSPVEIKIVPSPNGSVQAVAVEPNPAREIPRDLPSPSPIRKGIQSFVEKVAPSQGHLLDESFEKIRDALDKKQISSVELARESLRRIAIANPQLNAYISVLNEDGVLKNAELADKKIAAKEQSPVTGIPLAIKDLILLKDSKTTAGSKMLEGFVAPYTATVLEKLEKAGSVFVGKTNLDEFAMGSSNESSFFGVCKNPWDLTRIPGGSSGGSAAAVASKTLPFSLGTDTGGSIRQPATMTGITGIKPTYGRVSRYGVIAYASSLDQVGPMCSDALGCAAILEHISGHDSHDATSSTQSVPSFYSEARSFSDKDSLKGIRIGLPKEYFAKGLNPEIESSLRKALKLFQEQGAELKEIELPHTRFSLPVYYLISTSEASSNLARYDGIHFGYRSPNWKNGTLEELYSKTRGEGFGDETKLRILLGTHALSSGYYDAYYKKASQVRALIKEDFKKAFESCDLIAGPVAPSTAFKIGEKTNDPLSMYLSDVYTLSTNLAGLPGLSMNVGFDSQGLPLGMQLMTPWWEESLMLGLAAWYQKRNPSSMRAPQFTKQYFSNGASR